MSNTNFISDADFIVRLFIWKIEHTWHSVSPFCVEHNDRWAWIFCCDESHARSTGKSTQVHQESGYRTIHLPTSCSPPDTLNFSIQNIFLIWLSVTEVDYYVVYHFLVSIWFFYWSNLLLTECILFFGEYLAFMYKLTKPIMQLPARVALMGEVLPLKDEKVCFIQSYSLPISDTLFSLYYFSFEYSTHLCYLLLFWGTLSQLMYVLLNSSLLWWYQHPNYS